MPASDRRQVLLVLGMHRSGTSATAGLLARLGARAAATPIRADADNPKGYWEPEPIVSLHNRLLAAAGSAWDDWGRLDPDRLPADAADELAGLFRAEFGDAPLAVLKDPRICRFVPLWREVLARLDAAPKVVIPLRHPLAVAGSLARRDGMPQEAALLLWLRHCLEAERATRDLPRSFLRYDALLADWRAEAGRLAAELDLAWPDPEAAGADGFLEREMRHHREADGLAGWAAEGWAALDALASGDAAARDRLDALSLALDAADALMGAAARRQRQAAAQAEAARAEAEAHGAALAAQAEAADAAGAAARAEAAAAAAARAAAEAAAGSAQAELARLRGLLGELGGRSGTLAARNAALGTALAACEAERDALLASRSWRLTAPLRRAAGWLRRPRLPAAQKT